MQIVSSFCASRLSSRDATSRMSATERLLRSSVAAAAPSQQHYNLASNGRLIVASLLKVLPSSMCCWQHLGEGRGAAAASRGGTQHASCSCCATSAPSQQHQFRRSSISSVAAAAAGDGSVPRR